MFTSLSRWLSVLRGQTPIRRVSIARTAARRSRTTVLFRHSFLSFVPCTCVCSVEDKDASVSFSPFQVKHSSKQEHNSSSKEQTFSLKKQSSSSKMENISEGMYSLSDVASWLHGFSFGFWEGLTHPQNSHSYRTKRRQPRQLRFVVSSVPRSSTLWARPARKRLQIHTGGVDALLLGQVGPDRQTQDQQRQQIACQSRHTKRRGSTFYHNTLCHNIRIEPCSHCCTHVLSVIPVNRCFAVTTTF